jgi:hypothetical protein
MLSLWIYAHVTGLLSVCMVKIALIYLIFYLVTYSLSFVFFIVQLQTTRWDFLIFCMQYDIGMKCVSLQCAYINCIFVFFNCYILTDLTDFDWDCPGNWLREFILFLALAIRAVIAQSVLQRAVGWIAGVQFLAGQEIFLIFIMSRPALVTTHTLGTRCCFPSGKAAGIWSQGQEWWSYTSTPPHVFMV